MAPHVIVGQIILSVLAVFGAIFLFRVVFASFFAPDVMTVSVLVRTKKDADDLDILLYEAEKNVFRRKGIPPIVLISDDLMHGEIGNDDGLFASYRKVIDKYQATIYVIYQNQPSSA